MTLTFTILTSRGEEKIRATDCTFEEGALALLDDDHTVIRAFASGFWREIVSAVADDGQATQAEEPKPQSDARGWLGEAAAAAAKRLHRKG